MNRLQSNEVPVSLGCLPWGRGRGEVREFPAMSLAHGNGPQNRPVLFRRRQSGHSGGRFTSRK